MPAPVVERIDAWDVPVRLRRLEAMLAVMDKSSSFFISGTGDVLEPEDGIVSLGSGGPYALAAANAFIAAGYNKPEQIVRESLAIAGKICLYTNANITVETL